MAKGIILLEDIPRSCVECPMCYHATDMSIGKLQYEHLYRCGLEPEGAEQVYLEDICHEKPYWCPIKKIPERLEELKRPHSINDYQRKGFSRGWNSYLDKIERSAGE